MKAIDNLLKRIKNLNDGLQDGKILQVIIEDNEAFILDMNTNDQLFDKGINSLGVDISDYAPYSPITIDVKKAKGQPYNRVTLKDEGDFESSFFLEIKDTYFEIKAGDWKTENLIKKYGRQILGLTDENIGSLIWQYIYPDLTDEVKKIIYG